MRLSEQEYYQFMDIHMGLSIYVGKKHKILSKSIDFEDYKETSPETKIKIREKLIANPIIIDDFIEENPFNLDVEELEICAGFKHFIVGEFVLVKYLKKHTIFLIDNVAYGVLGLGDPIEYVLGGMSPLFVKGMLLPFKDKIVYDGVFQAFNIHFGGNISRSLNQEYNEAKASFGIVTSLPFQKPLSKGKDSLEKKLEYYMKNAKNREYYYYDIEELLEENPYLYDKYYALLSKINSRRIKKSLKELGITGLYYAVAVDTVVAMAESNYQVKEMVQAILPKEKQEWVHYFKI